MSHFRCVWKCELVRLCDGGMGDSESYERLNWGRREAELRWKLSNYEKRGITLLVEKEVR